MVYYSTILQIIIAIFIIRFHVNQYRLGGNFIVEMLNKYTSAITLPFSKVIRSRRDYSALIVGVIIAAIGLFILTKSPLYTLIVTIPYFLHTWINVVTYALFVVVLGSWLFPDPSKPIMQIAYSCTQWIMGPVRNIIPSFGGLDFSPILIFFVLRLVDMFIVSNLFTVSNL